MELKTATMIALILTCINVLFNLINFATMSSYYFRSLDSGGGEAALNLLWRLAGLASEGGLIFFLAVLYSKQKQQ